MVTERPDVRGATEAQAALGARGEPLGAVLTLLRDGRAIGSFRLSAGTCHVGAGPDNELIVDDSAVSRRHLRIELVPRGARFVDLGSKNGSTFQGQSFTDMTLSLGSSVVIGSTEIRVDADVEDFEGTRGRSVFEYGKLHGESSGMQRLFTLLGRLEGSLVNVLVEGESGTGKELVARALHERSLVKNGPWVALNCGAVDRTLVRSELFGHKKGAFTGAHGESVGAIGEADGGTLFLDEIGELPLDVQPILLRVLESGVYSRVGETKERPVRIRVVSATNRNLEDEVKAGNFRRDLYHRLMIVRLHIEPLRSRRAEIPGLVRHFSRELGLGEIPATVVEELSSRSFPGNVRELKHALLAYSAIGELPTAEDATPTGDLDTLLRDWIQLDTPYSELKERLTEKMTRHYLELLLERTQQNLSEASRVSGLQRGYLRSLCERYELRSSQK